MAALIVLGVISTYTPPGPRIEWPADAAAHDGMLVPSEGEVEWQIKGGPFPTGVVYGRACALSPHGFEA